MGAASRFASSTLRGFGLPTISTRTSRLGLVAMFLFVVSSTASAFTPNDCVLTIVEPSPATADPGDTVQFNILASAGTGMTGCSSAQISVAKTLDTTLGSGFATTPPTMVVVNTQAAVSISLPGFPQGGGSVTFKVTCNSGCSENMAPNPSFTVNVNDIYGLEAVSAPLFLAPGASGPVTVRVRKNGSLGGVQPLEGDVCFEIVPVTARGSSLSGGDGACMSDHGPGILAVPDLSTGEATVTFDSNGALCTDVQISAFADFPDDKPRQYQTLFASGDGILGLAATSGDDQSAFVGEQFANPLVVTLTCSGAPFEGQAIDFELLSAPAGTSINAPASVSTNSGGVAQVTLTAGSQAGFFSAYASLANVASEQKSGTFAFFENLSVENFYEMLHATPAQTTGSVGVGVDLGILLTFNGQQGQESEILYTLISWPDGNKGNLENPTLAFTNVAGIATFQFIPGAPGVYVVEALFDEDTGFGKVSGASPLSLQFTITVDDGGEILIWSQPTPPGYPGSTRELQVRVVGGESGLADDVINWTVSGPATLSAPTSVTNADGVASIQLTYGPGTGAVAVTATREVDIADTVTFTELESFQFVMTALSANPASAGVNETIPFQIRLERNGASTTPANGQTIDWFATGPGETSITGAFETVGGLAAADITFATAGTYTVIATFIDPEPPAGSTSQIASVAFSVTVAGDSVTTLTAASGDNQAARAGQSLPLMLVVVATDDNEPPSSPVTIEWAVSPVGTATFAPLPSSTDLDTGEAAVTVTLAADAVPGPITLVATRSDSGDEATFSAEVLPPVVKTLVKPGTDSGDGQSAPTGSELPLPLRVFALDDGSAASGVTINWSVTGDATLSSTQTVTDAQGGSSVSVNLGNNTGVVTVVASRQDAPAASTSFVATSVGPSLSIVSGSAQRGPMQTTGDFPLVAALLTADNQPLVARTVQWQVLSGPVVLDASSSQTDASGRASIGFRYGDIPGQAVVRVTSADAAGFVDFTLESLQAALMGAATGDSQSGRPGRTLPADFVVSISPPDGKALGGVTVFWEVIEGGGTLRSATSLTDAAGLAGNRLTLGPELGTNRVVASIPGGGQVVFTAEAVAPAGQLRIISGNSQTLPTNEQSAPLVVEVVDANGVPLDGVRVRWTGLDRQLGSTSTPSAEVADEVTVTNAQGRTSTTAKVLLPGAARVEAKTIDAITTPVVFGLNAAIANIPGLNEGQRGTSDAVDNACPALAALANRTAAQEDLYQRCLELINNAGDNPDEVRRALDQIPSELGDSMVDAAFGALGTQFSNHSQRFEVLRKNQAGGKNQFNIALWTPTGVLPLSFLPSAIVQSSDDSGGGEVGSEFDRWGFFATGTIGRGKSRGQNRTPGFEFDTSGITAGVDYRFSDRFVGGMSVGFSRNDAETRGGDGSIDTRGWTLSGYASWFNDRNWYVDGVLSYGANDYTLDRALAYTITALDGSRTVVDQRARADSEGSLLGTAVSVGRDFQRGAWNISTYLRGNYARVDLDAYEERMLAGVPGAGLALRFDSRTLNSVTSALGGKATWVLSRDWGVLMPHAQVEWEHEFRDSPANLVARFAHDPTNTPIATTGTEIDTDYFNVGVGISALFPGGRAVYIYYEQLMGASRLSQGTLSIGGRFEF
jgi:outer membrane autotransporter protein